MSDDRARALEWAERCRSARQQVIDRLASGEWKLVDVIAAAAGDDLVGRIKVLTVVEALPGWGKVASRRTLESIGVAETTPIASADHDALTAAFAHAPVAGVGS